MTEKVISTQIDWNGSAFMIFIFILPRNVIRKLAWRRTGLHNRQIVSLIFTARFVVCLLIVILNGRKTHKEHCFQSLEHYDSADD